MSLRVDVDSSETESSKGSTTRSHRKEGVPKFRERMANREVEYVNEDFWPKVVEVMNSRLSERDATTTTPNPFSRKSSNPFRSNFATLKDTSTSNTRKRNMKGVKKSNVRDNHILEEQRLMRLDELKTRDKNERKKQTRDKDKQKKRGGRKYKTRRHRSI